MSQQVYRVLLLGESWAHVPTGRAEQAVSLLRGHSGELAEVLRPFTVAADRVVAGNPAARLSSVQNPGILGAQSGILTRLQIRRFVGDLQQAGVDAVGLAAPGVLGVDSRSFGRLQRALTEAQVSDFGAGVTPEEAYQPHRIALPEAVGAGEIHLHGCMWSTTSDPETDSSASDSQSHALCARVGATQAPGVVAGAADTFRVALPLWGSQSRWRTLDQFHTAEKLLDADYDLVLGHGPAAGQEVLRHRRRWVVHSMGDRAGSGRDEVSAIGTGNFRFFVMLEVSFESGMRSLRLKLYPVVPAAGRHAASGIRLCEEPQLATVVESLQLQSPNGWSFDNPARGSGQDDLGWYIQLDLGSWPIGEPPQRAPGLLGEGDPDQTQPFRTYAGIRQGLERFSPERHLGSSLNAEAAEMAGAEVEWVTSKLAVATTEQRSYLIDGYMAHSSQVGAEACTDKYQTHTFLRRAGVPVTQAALARSADEAWEAAEQIGLPVVIKPADRDRARGVSVNLSTAAEVAAAFGQARLISRRVMVEQHIDIETEMRVMASNTECVSITERILPEVWGDGFSTIEQLIEERNLYRSSIFSLKGKDALIGESAVGRIEEQGFTLQDIPEAGGVVIVGAVGGQSSGGDIAELSHKADSTIRSTAVAAVHAIPSLRWGGVDLMIERGTGDVYVLEVNSRSGYGSAKFPSFGTPKDVAGRVWQLREEHAQEGAQPSSDESVPALRAGSGPALKQLPYAADQDRSLAQLLFAFAEHYGYRVKRRGPRLRQLTSPEGDEQLLTWQGLGAKDLAVAVRMLSKFGTLDRILKAADIPLVQSRTVTNAEQAERFLRQHGPGLITPFHSAWGGVRTQSLAPGEAERLDFTDRWIIQEQPSGHLLRVLAFRDGALAVTGAEPDVAAAPLAAAERLAVQAVQAVPQLRWGVVEVVVPADGDDYLPPAGLVQGMSLTPRFYPADTVVAGDLDRFFQRLLGEDRQWQRQGTAIG